MTVPGCGQAQLEGRRSPGRRGSSGSTRRRRLAEDGGLREDRRAGRRERSGRRACVREARLEGGVERGSSAVSTSSWATLGNSSRVPPVVASGFVTDRVTRVSRRAGSITDRVGLDVACGTGLDGRDVDVGPAWARSAGRPGSARGDRHGRVRPEPDAAARADDAAAGDRVGAHVKSTLRNRTVPFAAVSSTRLPVAAKVSLDASTSTRAPAAGTVPRLGVRLGRRRDRRRR